MGRKDKRLSQVRGTQERTDERRREGQGQRQLGEGSASPCRCRKWRSAPGHSAQGASAHCSAGDVGTWRCTRKEREGGRVSKALARVPSLRSCSAPRATRRREGDVQSLLHLYSAPDMWTSLPFRTTALSLSFCLIALSLFSSRCSIHASACTFSFCSRNSQGAFCQRPAPPQPLPATPFHVAVLPN